MTSNQKTKTFTVPVGTRLSYGIELELLVAYLYPSDVDPDELNSSTLAPILRVNHESSEDVEMAVVQGHIRTTLRDHGIRVRDPKAAPNYEVPLHLEGLDSWDVYVDSTVKPGTVENGKWTNYKWFGLELRSPACWDGPRAHDETRFVVNLLKSRYRVRVNASCGFHVHVGNGPRYFDAKTLKRAGAFLWAADPMLSRLHAPWRRVGEYAATIRYRSRLACWRGMRPADAQILVGRDAALLDQSRDDPDDPATLDPIPVVPWSNTAREEAELGGREKWERYAHERVQNGPFITLSERLSSPQESERSSATPDRSGTSPSYSPPSSSSSDGSSNAGDNGGAYDRLFQHLLRTDAFRARCLREYGHEYPEVLTSNEQYTLLIIEMCERVYGHTSVIELSDSEYEHLMHKCAPYTNVMRSSWRLDPNADILYNANIGADLEQPRARPYNRKNPSLAVVRLQQLVELQDRGEIDGDYDSPLPPNDESNDEYGSANEDDLEKYLLDRLDVMMEDPDFPIDNVDGLVNETKRVKDLAKKQEREFARRLARVLGNAPPSPSPSPPVQSRDNNSLGSSQSSTDSSGGFNPAASRALDKAFGAVNSILARPSSKSGNNRSSTSPSGLRGGIGWSVDMISETPIPSPGSDDSYSTSSSEPDSSANSGSPNSRASKELRGGGNSIPSSPAANKEPAEATDTTESSSFVYSASTLPPNNRARAGEKLQPHDIAQLSDSYIARVTRDVHLTAAHWQRISWLPLPDGEGRPDPLENHTRDGAECAGPYCRDHVVTDTRTGLGTILGVNSAAAVAMLLVNPGEEDDEDEAFAPRLNYNFMTYGSFIFRSGIRFGEKRTIEFREAGGSLDAEWIVAWSKICIGILRFCRDASVADFITVLERVVGQEERLRDGRRVTYDVCDLLEDVGLFAEAAIVRRQERRLGPPR